MIHLINVVANEQVYSALRLQNFIPL